MSRVRMPGFHGYQHAPDFAWSGWRYKIPGGPEGGQYHGFIAPDSTQSWEGGHGGWPAGSSEITDGPQKRPSGHSILPGQGTSKGPWAKEWGGTSFDGGETHSDYVYRSSAEMRPRPNASGGQNVIFGHEDGISAGFAEAPGNYRSLGAVPMPPGASTGSLRYPFTPEPVTIMRPRYPYDPNLFPPVGTIPAAGAGATNVVASPPPFRSPGPIYMIPYSSPGIAPTPAPAVNATPADFLPSQGQTIPGLTPGATATPATGTSFADWLSESTIFPSIQNQWVVIGGVLALVMFSGRGKR
jgi:hypothetical protein